MFLYTPDKGFVGINNKSEEGDGVISFAGRLPRDVLVNDYIGFAQINGEACFISAVPVLTPSGEILGSLISSIGKKSDLYAAYDAMLKKQYHFRPHFTGNADAGDAVHAPSVPPGSVAD